MNTENETATRYGREFSDRLRYLRNKKKISAREMSIALGQNVNYINLIENGKRFPSLQGFFAICDYLKITPSIFFDSEYFVSEFFESAKKTENEKKELRDFLETLSTEEISSILNLVKVFNLHSEV
ncbi:MAG: helix-turn-helix transcriptional regulator [Spirochaetia bacterium]|uniref:helix-turn-helix domain-containing protein n=1 Tax=Treponema berlinense TaxID=225004 RepID=UPI0026F1CCB6|nr:helix-turn-helix transcriptional regulator [Treponema berlinense]MDD5790549.1 helix-turn-helix transcriptional regulator [Spirochaetia bacterium]